MELPKVFANPIKHKIDNVQEIYQEGNRGESMDVENYVNEIYSSGRIVYMMDFIFNVNGIEFEDRIATKGSDYLITRSNKKIYFKDIKYIKEIKKA